MRWRARDRPGHRAVLRAIQVRSADRSLGAVRSGAAGRGQAGPVRGAGLGDLRAADRVFSRAAAIERRLIARLGRRCRSSGMRDAPTAAVLAVQAPALLQSFDLSGGRAVALVRAAREVAHGRVDLYDSDHERGWRRLRAIRGIGSWTIQMLGADRPRPARPAAVRRRGVSEARRAAAGIWRSMGARHRGGGRGVLRALRAVGGAGGAARAADRWRGGRQPRGRLTVGRA